jgi:hypothetical protein
VVSHIGHALLRSACTEVLWLFAFYLSSSVEVICTHARADCAVGERKSHDDAKDGYKKIEKITKRPKEAKTAE